MYNKAPAADEADREAYNFDHISKPENLVQSLFL